MSGLLLLPLIGCWVESGGEAPESRSLYGVSGNLVLRRGGACESDERWSDTDDVGRRRLRLNARWTLVENVLTGERYLLYKDNARYALPVCSGQRQDSGE